jgi:hypothetical protein
MKKSLYTLLITGLTAIMSACSHQNNFEVLSFAVIVDKSESQTDLTFNSDQFVDNLFDPTALIESGNGISFSVVELGASPIPQTSTIELQGANMWMASRRDRTTVVDEFISEAKSSLNVLINNPNDQQFTQVYRTLLYTVSLINENADKKIIYISSDFLESSKILKMEKLKAFEYEKIMDLFLADQAMQDLTGFEIIMVCNSTGESSYQAVQFWKRFLSEAGASVKLRSSF